VRDIYLDRLSQAATWLDDPAAQKAPPPPAPSPSPAPG
jgi:hypothetical protein